MDLGRPAEAAPHLPKRHLPRRPATVRKMNWLTQCALVVIACATSILCQAPLAHAGQPTGLVATTGSIFMDDEFTSTGPPGTFWQPVITRQDIGPERFELTMLQ